MTTANERAGPPFGWFGDALDRPDALDAMTAGAQGLRGDGAGIAFALGGGALARQQHLYAALDGRCYWDDSEYADIAAARGSAHALLAAYRRRDADCFAALRGVFSAILVDAEQRRVLAAIDRIGQRTLYYFPSAGGVVFGASAAQVLAHPALGRELDLQGVYHYVYFHMLPSPDSIFKGLHKLPGGHRLDCRAGAAPRIDAYWQPDFGAARRRSRDLTALGADLKQTLRDAVGRQLDDAGSDRCGAFLSGGLDSTTVSGLLAEQRRPAPTFSIGFDADGYDEIPFARIGARHFSTEPHEYYVTPDDIVDAVPVIAAAYSEPFGNSSAIPTYYCAKLAADSGVRHLLAGDGGDELFAGNFRYAKQQVFEVYQRLPRAARGVFDATLPRLPTARPFGKLKSYAQQAMIPLPDRLQSYNFLHRIDPGSVFTGELLDAVDRERPLTLQRERYRQPEDADTIDRMLYLDWQHTLADNDLRKVNQMCAVNGVEVSYPFLDDAVVDFSCRVPTAMKLSRGRLRHFYKQAMADFLPPAVLGKSKHGFGLPFGVWMRDHPALQQLAYDNLRALSARGYFRDGFIDDAIDRHRRGHAGYYGGLIWVLMMLELWLAAHL